ncbi:MAG: hypothetical protein PHU49_12835 [Syntrophorhabdaceae bacterium]|nr:hypothetical protein [Syntrophorhabdaceae bacterium]MDD5244892.1 hypothetical protein [Syntrophorhabdaceae bacterium]
MSKDLKYVEVKMTPSQFWDMMNEVDTFLASQNVPIHARPIRAFLEVGKRLHVNILIAPAHKITDPILFTSHNIATHISNWYDERYGDRLKIHMGPGSVAILIRGDAWKVVLPRVYGLVTYVCDPEIEKYKNMPKFSTRGRPIVLNIFNCIENMTEHYASQLSPEELKAITMFFDLSLKSLYQLEKIQSKPFIKEALSDLGSAVYHIFNIPPHYGFSKWSSLQFIEKQIKSLLKIKGVNFPFKHDLSLLAKIATEHGLLILDEVLLDKVKCDPGIRYGEYLTSLKEAMDAHMASIQLAHTVSKAINI